MVYVGCRFDLVIFIYFKYIYIFSVMIFIKPLPSLYTKHHPINNRLLLLNLSMILIMIIIIRKIIMLTTIVLIIMKTLTQYYQNIVLICIIICECECVRFVRVE